MQSFENARQLGAVSRPIDQLNADYKLEIGIRRFYIAVSSSPTAVIDLTARLISNDKGSVAAARIFSASEPAKSTEAKAAVQAINQAFAKVAAEIVAWTAESL